MKQSAVPIQDHFLSLHWETIDPPMLSLPWFLRCIVKIVLHDSGLSWITSFIIFEDTSLRKHAYSNILKILPPKNENFQIKNSDIFHVSVQNIDYGNSLEPPQRGGSNEYRQSMFWAKIRKIMYTPVNPSFPILKWGLRGSKLYRYVFVMLLNWAYLIKASLA